MPYPGYTTEEVARRGRDLYERRIRAEVEHGGRFVVLDIATGDYEVADDLEASDRMVERNPGAIFYGTRIGERAAYRIGTSDYFDDNAASLP